MYTIYKRHSGFTLLELIIAVAVVAILMTIVMVNFGPAREQARDAQRQTDLRTVEAALVLYKNKYGRYPEACNGPTTNTNVVWSGQMDTDFECSNSTVNYAAALVPEFLPRLPIDPKLNGTNSGYVYTVNDEGSVYKFMALNTVETTEVDQNHPLFRCGADFVAGTSESGASYDDPGICQRTPTNPSSAYPIFYVVGFWNSLQISTSGTLDSCSLEAQYQTTFAVSGGFSNDARGASNQDRGREYDTEIVRCG